MNLFKILASGDGRIDEPNVSSFYAYIIDPFEGHGLGSRALQALLAPLIAENKEYYKELGNLNNMLKGKQRYDVWVDTEISVYLDQSKETSNKNKRRDIDILVEIINPKEEIEFAFCIENKIRRGSEQVNQLREEMDGLKNYYMGMKENPKIGLIYITPDFSEASNKIYKDDTEKMDFPHIHMTWNSNFSNLSADSEKYKYVFYQLLGILDGETKGLSEPIFDFTKHTIKAFLSFIDSDFKSLKEEKGEGRWAKTVFKDFEEFISKSGFTENDRISKLGKEINDILVSNEKLIPRFTSSCISFSLNEKIKNKYRVFIWMTFQRNSIRMGFAMNSNMSWSDYEKQLKEIPNIKLIPPRNPYGFDIIISNMEEFNETVLPIIPFVKGHLLGKR